MLALRNYWWVTATNMEGRQDLPASLLDQARSKFATFLRSNGLHLSEQAHVPITGTDLASPFCWELFYQWAVWAEDPAADIALWTRDGAPANIMVNFNQLAGVMPKVNDDMASLEPEALSSDYDNFVNHGQLEADQEALSTIFGYVKLGYLNQGFQLVGGLCGLSGGTTNIIQICMSNRRQV